MGSRRVRGLDELVSLYSHIIGGGEKKKLLLCGAIMAPDDELFVRYLRIDDEVTPAIIYCLSLALALY
jgi:hypothetical protein